MIRRILSKIQLGKSQSLLLSAVNSLLFVMYFSFFVALVPLRYTEVLTLIIILLLLHLPVILAVLFKWRLILVISIIGWVIIWGGTLMYGSQMDNTMRDLAVISWVLFSWAAVTGFGIIAQIVSNTVQNLKNFK